ncbi:SUKH-4 family immunity protein [Actinokineospora globicatena]|uniref:SUKH-4 family immunity protein n=1 Tax=Actinokineospora globicatena TaxID=103729 RepID=UPI002555BD46|nr:SUKH-4 family immunity protein [Actinokineospora globicatena]
MARSRKYPSETWAVLTRPVRDLVVLDQRRVPTPGVLAAWDLPEVHTRALTDWGVPNMPDDFLSPAALTDPAALAWDDLVELATLPVMDGRVGLDLSTGEVRYRRPSGYEGMVNSSVGQFLEVAWRWYWLIEVLDYENFDEFVDEDSELMFFDFLRCADPLSLEDERGTLWGNQLEDD